MCGDTRLRVLFLASSYPRNEDDTASVFLRYLARELQRRNIDVEVLVPADGEAETGIEEGIKVHRFQYFPVALQGLAYGSGVISNLSRSPWLWLQVPFFLLAMAYGLIRRIHKGSPDLIHAHWILPQGIIAIAAKLFYRIPVITTAHGADAYALRGKIFAFFKRVALRKSNVWTTNTLATARVVGHAPSLSEPVVIPMGVDVMLFSQGNPIAYRKEIPANEFLVLFVGRLVEKKGCQDLLVAFAHLSPALKARTSLWIVGDGDQRIHLEKLAKNLAIANKVRFWGTISNRRLPDIYAAADLFVAPSIEAESGDTEGQGVVLLEAFAARTCVLATRVGGIDAVVRDNITGILVPPKQPTELAQGIAKLIDDSALRSTLIENAFAEVNECYDWPGIAGKFEDLYRQVLHTPHK